MTRKKYHLFVTLPYCVREIRLAKFQGRQQDVVSMGGEPLTNDAALTELSALRKKGLEGLPCGDCDNYDNTGRCQGHPND